MAVNLDDISSGYSTGKINTNFQKVEDELNNNTLRRKGLSPGESNQMETDLDMNGFNLLNVGNLTEDGTVTPEGGISQPDADARYVNLTGDTMSGALNIELATASTHPIRKDTFDSAVTDLETTDSNLQAQIDSLGSGTSEGAFSTVSDMKASTTLEIGQNVVTYGYTSKGDGGANQYEIVAAGTGVDDGGSFIDLPGSGHQAKAIFPFSSFNVFQFGAVGDGVTDDAPAIQAIIDFVGTGETVFFPSPSSSYLVSSTININKRIKLEGSQAKVTSSSAITFFDITEINAEVEGFVIEGNRTVGQKGIRIGNDWVKVRDCTITLTDWGVEVWGGVWQRIEHIRMRNIANTVMEIGNVVGTVVEDLRYDTDVATYAEPTTGLRLYGEGCNFSDMDLIHAGTACYIFTNSSRDSTWNFFNSCSFDTSTYGLRISNTASDFSVKGAMFDHCWFSSHRENGIFLDGNFNTDGLSFKGCYIINNEKGGLFIAEASNNVETVGCTFAANSQASPGTYPHIRHSSAGTVSSMDNHFTDWGLLTGGVSAAIERTSSGSYLIIDGCYAEASRTGSGLIDNSTSPIDIGINYDNLPSSSTSTSGDFIENTTTEQTGNINLSSTSTTANTIRVVSSNLSGIEGISSDASNYGGVFSNTAGGTGLRVNQGNAQFAGDAQIDSNLNVSGTSTLSGNVGGTGFINSVDNRVSYETLDGNGDVGTGSTQVARGNHTHVKSDITDLQNYRMFGTTVTTDGSGRATFSHGLGTTPALSIHGTFGGAANKVDAVALTSTSVTVEVRDITNNGALKTGATITIYTIVAENP